MLKPQLSSKRQLIGLNGIWKFTREHETPGNYHEGFDEEKLVPVPCSYNDLFTDNEFRMWDKGVWYEKKIIIPHAFTKNRIVLRFSAVNYKARVYFNGAFVTEHEGGYTPFEVDVTHHARVGKRNLICVRVENQLCMNTVPMGNLKNPAEPGQIGGQYPDMPFDFFPYTGIHRPVELYTTSNQGWIESVYIESKIIDGDAVVKIRGDIGGDAKEITIAEAESGSCMSSLIDKRQFELDFLIKNPIAWDVENPKLYELKMSLHSQDGDKIDEYTQNFGIREVTITDGKLLLNGKPIYLKGFGRHEDFPIIGKGLNDAVNIRDYELIRWINANSYRTTHYPYSEELIELADRQGILIISESPAVSLNFDYSTDATLQMHKQAIRELVERDYNHPSVIMWSVANEANTDRPEARVYFDEVTRIVREIDRSRPITMATCKFEQDHAADLFDVLAINVYPGWYYLPGQIEAAAKDLGAQLKRIHNKFNKPILVSEFGADTIAGFHSLPAEQWSEEYQVELIEALIKEIRKHSFVIGEHVWTFSDFRTAQNHSRVGGNKKGVFTRERQPKMIAHALKRIWSQVDL